MDDIIKNTTFPRRWSFRELDFFSGGTSVKIKSDERVKSSIGAIISLGLYVLLGFAIYYFVNEFLDTASPQTIQINEESRPEPFRFGVGSEGEIEGLNMFFLVTNPASTAGTTSPYYLSYDTLKRYYETKSFYTETTYEIVGQISKRLDSKKRDVRLVPCKETVWFQSKDFDTAAASNRMNKFIIEEFAICPIFETDMPIFGDEQTMSTGIYRMTLSPCTVGCDPDFAYNTITSASGQKVILGTFKPVIENANKNKPFKYELSFETEVPINTLAIGKVVMSLSSLQTKTDHGLFINDWETEQRASVGVANVYYTPAISVGSEIANSDDFGVRFISDEPPFQLKVQSSRRSKQIIRTYVSLPAMIGNIGGAIEAVVLIVLVVFNWYENLNIETKISACVAESLHLPEDLHPSDTVAIASYAKCCKKRNKELAFKAQSSEVVGEIVDKALSIEQMSQNHIMLNFFLENSFPDEIRQLVPVVYVMKEILASLEDEETRDMLTLGVGEGQENQNGYQQPKQNGQGDPDSDTDPKRGPVQNIGSVPSQQKLDDLQIPDELVDIKIGPASNVNLAEDQALNKIQFEEAPTENKQPLKPSLPFNRSLTRTKSISSSQAIRALMAQLNNGDEYCSMRHMLMKTLQRFAALKGIEKVEDLFKPQSATIEAGRSTRELHKTNSSGEGDPSLTNLKQ